MTSMLNGPNTLYDLLPAYLKLRDRQADRATEQMLGIVSAQVDTFRRDLVRMYDGWFVETCDEWLVPYLGELVGVEASQLALGQTGGEHQVGRRSVLSARAAVANTIAARRRKGTLWVLEELARDHVHWPARAVELYRRLAMTSHIDHLQPTRPAFADVHDARRLLDLDGPFDDFGHLGDVRRISNEESRGQYQIGNVGLFVWRTRPYTVTATPAYCREDAGTHCYTFSALGNDSQLFRQPVPEATESAIAGQENLPVPISVWALESSAPPDAGPAQADAPLYGDGGSLFIEAADWPKRGPVRQIAAAQVIPADLSDWAYKVPKNHVAVDPVLGRIAFPSSQPPRRGVKVTYRYGFAADLGGGEYVRPAVALPAAIARAQVSNRSPATGSNQFVSVAAAYSDWRGRREQPPVAGAPVVPPALLIELMDSDVYSGRFNLELAAGETVALMAAPGTRPIIWLADDNAGASDAISVRGAAGSRVLFDGLLIAGRAVEVGRALNDGPDDDRPRPVDQPGASAGAGELCELWIHHCTLVPGGALHPNCEPRRPAEPSLVVDGTAARIRIESSIVGAIQVLDDESAARAPTPIVICDSILDATGDERTAIGGGGGEVGRAELSVARSTIVGGVRVHALGLVEDSIFTARIEVARRQTGCVRFCYVPPASRTPKRYACQPDRALGQAAEMFADRRPALEKTLAPAAIAALEAQAAATALARATPRFESLRYGTSTYLRLTACTDPAIKRGAHDESEMGVYHDLFEAVRLSILTDRLADFIPASCDGAVIFAS